MSLQEISRSQNADKPIAPRERFTQQPRGARKTNKAMHPSLAPESR